MDDKQREILGEHQYGDDLLAVISTWQGLGADEFDVAEALYWAAVHCYDGQWCPLYALIGALGFRPSPLSNGPEAGGCAAMIHQELVEILTNC